HVDRVTLDAIQALERCVDILRLARDDDNVRVLAQRGLGYREANPRRAANDDGPLGAQDHGALVCEEFPSIDEVPQLRRARSRAICSIDSRRSRLARRAAERTSATR